MTDTPNLGDLLIQAMRDAIAYERGELTGVRTSTVTRMGPAVQVEAPPEYTAEEIAEIRKRLAQSQQVFARSLAVSPKTVRAWEHGVRRPDGAARRLLQIAAERPEVLTSKVHVSRRAAGQ